VSSAYCWVLTPNDDARELMMIFFSEALVYKLVYCRYVGAAFLISLDIVILIRCWLYWTMIWLWPDDFYYCRSWTINTWVVTSADDYIDRWFDDAMMILTPPADHGLVNYADDCYTMSWWCLRRRCCCCCLPSPFRPATSLSSWWWFPVFVRQSSFVLMNIYYADDGSLVSSPYSPLS